MNATSSIFRSSSSGIVQAASAWRVRHDAGLSPAEQAEFAAWLTADSQHAAAWRDVNATLSALDHVRAAGLADDYVQELSQRRRRRRQRLVAGCALGLAASLAVLLLVRPEPQVTALSDTAPVILRVDRRVLEDGSTVELNAGAEISVNYSPARREVRLLRGEALFQVESNAARPFVVISREVEVRAVGTAFVVQEGARTVDVLVTEGSVSVGHVVPAAATVSKATTAAPPVILSAGSQLAVPPPSALAEPVQPRALSPAEIDRRLAWRQPRMQLSGTPLAEAVEVLNRENRLQVVIADESLAQLLLTGVYRLDDATGFVHVLESHYAVQVERHADGSLILRQGRAE